MPNVRKKSRALVFITETRERLPKITSVVVFDALPERDGIDDAITEGPEYRGPALLDDGSGAGE